MKRYILLLFLLSTLFLLAYVKNNHPILPETNLNIIIASDMGCRGDSEQKNIAELMGHFAEQNRIDFLVVAGDPIHDNGVQSVEDEDPGFTACSADNQTFKFFFINHKGENVYSYTINK